MKELKAEIKPVLLDAIKQAGALILKRFYEAFEIESKDDVTNNLVTEVDKASELLILDIVKKSFPHHGIVGEEYGSANEQAAIQWHIDPIDGTVNFAHGIPICCVSIAVALHEEVIIGAVFNPMMNELFYAAHNEGAYLNDKPIHVSSKTDLGKACLVTGFPYVLEKAYHPLPIFAHFLEKGFPIRRLGSAAIDLCWVAAGRFDAFWEQQLKSYDIAAGCIIVKEAGGTVTNFKGEAICINGIQLLASNKLLHQELLQEINYATTQTEKK